jgi:hypothetical protein
MVLKNRRKKNENTSVPKFHTKEILIGIHVEGYYK